MTFLTHYSVLKLNIHIYKYDKNACIKIFIFDLSNVMYIKTSFIRTVII